MKRFRIKYSKKIVLITLMITFLFVLTSVGLFIKAIHTTGELVSLIYGVLSFCILITPLLLFLNNPTHIELHSGNSMFLIKRPFGTIALSVDKICSLREVPNFYTAMSVSTKGMFGIIGTTMDGYTSYITDKNNIVALESATRKILFSCENPRFLIWDFENLKY